MRMKHGMITDYQSSLGEKYEVLAGLVDEFFIASFLCEGKKISL